MLVHANIAPFKAFVREDVLYDMDHSKAGNMVSCYVIGVSSYPGSVPTFQIVVDGTSLFSYVPPHLLSSKQEVNGYWLDLNEVVYHNCPQAEFAVVAFDYLRDKQLQIWVKSRKGWYQGKYVLTLDWYQGNDLLHCVEFSNGQFGFLPQHKMLLGGAKEFKPYKKLHREWTVSK